MMVADTVLVKEAGTSPEVLTSVANKAWSDVAYFLKVEFQNHCSISSGFIDPLSDRQLCVSWQNVQPFGAAPYCCALPAS